MRNKERQMKKVLLLTLALTSAGTVLAETNTTSTSSSTTATVATTTTATNTATTTATTSTASTEEATEKAKGSPFHLSLYNELMTQVDDVEKNGLTNNLYIMPSYKINDNWSLGLNTQIDQTVSIETGKVENSFNRTYLNIYRKNILTEEKHGVSLTGHVRLQGYYNSVANAGYSMLGLNFSKNFGDKINTYFVNRYVSYVRKTGADGTGTGYWLPILGASYSFNDKWSARIEGYYLYLPKLGDGNFDSKGKKIYAHEETFLTLSGGYQATDKLNVGAYIANYLNVAHSGANEAATYFDNATFALTLSYSIL